MDPFQVIESLRKDGVKATIIFDEKSLQSLLWYAIAFALTWGICSALVRKYIV